MKPIDRPKTPDLTEFDLLAVTDELRAANRRLQASLVRAKAKTDELALVVREAARDAVLALGPMPAIVAPKLPPSSKGPKGPGAEVALWDTGDWQGAKRTSTYDSGVMLKRVGTFVDSCIELTNLHRLAVPVDEAVIVFGGDMIEGLFNFPSQPFEVDATLFGQYVLVSRLLVDVVRRALATYTKVRVVAEWGNHGRIGSKRQAVPRADNFDRMCYEHARDILAGEKRLTWQDCPDDIQRLEVGNYRALVIHGDEVGRSGYVSRTRMREHVHKWLAGGFRIEGDAWPFRDVYVHHYHTHAEEPLANGEGSIFWTGSTESDNRYARDGMGESARPSQRLHFIDPRKGRVTAQYRVYVDGGELW